MELQGAKTDVGASSIGCSSDAECDDGDACNGLETCSAGVCQPGTPLDCDDGDACTEDSCDPVSGCVNVSTKPTADAGDDVTICDGESTTLDATGSTGTGLTYAWSPGCSASATHTVSPTTDTTYTVVVTATGGCTDSDEVTVTVCAKPDNAEAGPDKAVCAGESAVLGPGDSLVPGPNGNYAYSWSPPDNLDVPR
ncbi:MAG: hypothetical protein JRK53_00365 [Deltaproteobacteria bacterium]|nr:hypothetical protein [Deltaproteobacteria bacterium]